ncbi:aspartate--tRNA(Asn) ligase [Acidaminobacter sp. JC074]|uniref:aspartate--tRNA(Asn) ligase n=1 Tax=Acidaminobacter sp. JC074 TaxID=2530199 RepID=UPI001F0ED0EC|nr:aspartate--tRNA(Asn) ligase [Acidaminobacter sp. JC074]MCH4887560.1 aspartate--tRNA(Asn) ligase [Acidaminobacter sp. JC074]
MKRTMIESIKPGKVKVCGWIHRVKKLKAVVFLILRDKTGFIQVVMRPEDYEGLKLESVVSIIGQALESPNKYGLYEIRLDKLQVLSESQDLPIAVNQSELNVNLDTILNHRVLALRHEKDQAIFKIQAQIAHGFRSFLESHLFTEIHTPKLVKEGAEGGANVFELDYFGQKAYLAQSPQFYKQMMVIAGLERVYEIGPVFRAESHSTIRHLNEYTSMDFEMGFVEDISELMALETELLKFIIHQVNVTCKRELEVLNTKLPKIESIPCMTLQEAIEILNKEYGKHLEGDLDPEGELLIYEYIKEKTGSDFVFLTNYPKYKRPMYTMPNGQYTKSFDLLFRGLEITTGGLRIHNLNMLKESMLEKGLEPKDYESYLEAFKYGVPPHGGLAIGLERLTAKLLNIENIRRTTLFPRDKQRLTP